MISIGRQFVFNGVGGCEVYGGICGCRLLYMSISMCVFLLVIVRSRKLMWPSDSSVGLNCGLLWIVLVYWVR